MKFNVPLVPDEGYMERLAADKAKLAAVHTSLFLDAAQDGRHRMDTLSAGRLAGLLKPLDGVPVYGLLNSRFHPPTAYADDGLRPVAKRLEHLLDAGVLHGIVVVDFYYLRALSNFAPDVAASLVAVPGVNCLLDSEATVRSWITYAAETTRFRPADKVVLDRTLNRDPERLALVSRKVKRKFPGLSLELLANEGCLANCPFALAHASHMAAQTGNLLADADALDRNATLGCLELFLDNPQRLLASPFIRPEDADVYEGLVDGLKLCGRTRGPRIMADIVSAYLTRRSPDNLLDLLDAPEVLANVLEIRSRELPADFAQRMSSCRGVCQGCGQCADFAPRAVRRTPPRIESM